MCETLLLLLLGAAIPGSRTSFCCCCWEERSQGAGPLSVVVVVGGFGGPRFGHIFATVARIDKLLGYSERGRRTTSEYTIYLIKLARPENISELFDIFG